MDWRMQWVASTLHTTSEHGVSSITTADAAHLCCQQSTELTPSGRFKWTRPFPRKTKSGFCGVSSHFKRSLPLVRTARLFYTATVQNSRSHHRSSTGSQLQGKASPCGWQFWQSRDLDSHVHSWKYVHLKQCVCDRSRTASHTRLASYNEQLTIKRWITACRQIQNRNHRPHRTRRSYVTAER